MLIHSFNITYYLALPFKIFIIRILYIDKPKLQSQLIKELFMVFAIYIRHKSISAPLSSDLSISEILISSVQDAAMCIKTH